MESLKTNVFGITKLMLFALLFTSCLSQKKVMLLQDKGAPQDNFENKKKTAYQVQTGDHLYIKIYSLDPKTSKFFQTDLPTLMNPTYLYLNSYLVDEEGYIDFSFVERMQVKGMTVDEIKKKIQTALNEYFKETTVVVKLVDFQVSVLGEVNHPGNFTIDKDQINVLQAISLAGGTKDFGNVKKITLVRQNLKGSEVHYLNLKDKNLLASEFYYLMPNDIIYVEPMKSKSYLVTSFPYTAVLSILSLGISAAILFNLND
ncbi:MAG TPA: polysaccharide biosynthesis/export family protein [Bacteroidales bacterium]|nr:polysaccharide biosynthesis/export family protein [Bacteroidales bacterium]